MFLILHYFFIVSHAVIILFTLLGWIVPAWRKAHLVLMLVTLFSWIVLGLRYGFGYCFWTDWHWQVRRRLGHQDLPSSFVKYLLDTVTGRDIDSVFVDWITAVVLIVVLCISIYVNWKSGTSPSGS